MSGVQLSPIAISTEPHRVICRIATSADAGAIIEMTTALAVETEGGGVDRARLGRSVANLLQAPPPDVQYWIVQEEEEVVGMALVWPQPFPMRGGMSLWLDDVYLRPSHRRGLFRKLTDCIIQSLEGRQDIVGLRLMVMLTNVRALTTYLRNEFEPDGHVVMAYGIAQTECQYRPSFVTKFKPPVPRSFHVPPHS